MELKIMEFLELILDDLLCEVINSTENGETKSTISTEATEHVLNIVMDRTVEQSEKQSVYNISREILEEVFEAAFTQRESDQDISNILDIDDILNKSNANQAHESSEKDQVCDNSVNFRDLIFESDSEPEDEIDDDKSNQFYKHKLFFHEVETAGRIKGLVHCISNDQKLSRSVEAMCIEQNLCEYKQLKLINELNYVDIFKTCNVSYTQVYESLRSTVCNKLTLQLKSVRDKLQNFITIRGGSNPELSNALTNIDSLLCLTNEEREDKFEENNYSTTAWLESAESVVKQIRLSLTSALPSSESETEDDEDNQDKEECFPGVEGETKEVTPNITDIAEEVICEFKYETIQIEELEPSTSKACSIRVASFAVDPGAAKEPNIESNLIHNLNPIKINEVHFPNFSYEIKSSYSINNWGSIRKPEKYHIFTSVKGPNENNAILIKLFIHCDNMEKKHYHRNPLHWKNASLMFWPTEKSPEYVEISFPNTGQSKIVAQLPQSAESLQPLLRKRMNFVLSFGRVTKIDQEYINAPSKTLCSAFCDSFFKTCKPLLKSLGCEWVKHKISSHYKAERVDLLTLKVMRRIPTDILVSEKWVKETLTCLEDKMFQQHLKAIQLDRTAVASCYQKYEISLEAGADALIKNILDKKLHFVEHVNKPITPVSNGKEIKETIWSDSDNIMNRIKANELMKELKVCDIVDRIKTTEVVKELEICPFESCNACIQGHAGKLHLYEKHMKSKVDNYIHNQISLNKFCEVLSCEFNKKLEHTFQSIEDIFSSLLSHYLSEHDLIYSLLVENHSQTKDKCTYIKNTLLLLNANAYPPLGNDNLCPFFFCDKSSFDSIPKLKKHIQRVHLKGYIEKEIEKRQMEMCFNSSDCPFDECGYIDSNKYNMILHYCETHGGLKRELQKIAEKEGLNLDYVKAKGIFGEFPSSLHPFPPSMKVNCLFCERIIRKTHEAKHIIMKHRLSEASKYIGEQQKAKNKPHNECPFNCIQVFDDILGVINHAIMCHDLPPALDTAAKEINLTNTEVTILNTEEGVSDAPLLTQMLNEKPIQDKRIEISVEPSSDNKEDPIKVTLTIPSSCSSSNPRLENVESNPTVAKEKPIQRKPKQNKDFFKKLALDTLFTGPVNTVSVIKETVNPVISEILQPNMRGKVQSDIMEIVSPEIKEIVNPKINEIVQPKNKEKEKTKKFWKIVHQEINEILQPKNREIVQPEFREIVQPEINRMVQPEIREIVQPKTNEILLTKINEIVQLEIMGKVQPENRATQIESQTNVLICPVYSICKKTFPVFSKNDVLTISEHANTHFPNVIYLKQYQMLQKIYGSNNKCPLPYCNKQNSITHYQTDHRFEAFIIFISEKERDRKIFETVRTYLPEEIKQIAKETEKYGRSEKTSKQITQTSKQLPNTYSQSKKSVAKPNFLGRNPVNVKDGNAEIIEVIEIQEENEEINSRKQKTNLVSFNLHVSSVKNVKDALPARIGLPTICPVKYGLVGKYDHKKDVAEYIASGYKVISYTTIERFVKDLLREGTPEEEARRKIGILNSGLTKITPPGKAHGADINSIKMIKDLWEVYDTLMEYYTYCTNVGGVENCFTEQVVLKMKELCFLGKKDHILKFLYFADFIHKPFKDGEKLKDKREIREYLLSIGEDQKKMPSSKEPIIIDITEDNSGKESLENMEFINNKLCCQTCKIYDIGTIEELEKHVESLSERRHVVGCLECKIWFSVLFKEGCLSHALSLHVVTKGHLFNIAYPDASWPLAASEQRPSCEVCWKALRFSSDRENHISDKTHVENVDILMKYLDYCLIRKVTPVTLYATPLPVKHFVFFLEVLGYQLHHIPRIKDRVLNVLSNYYDKIIVKSEDGVNVHDPFISTMKKYASGPIASIFPSFICYTCMRVLYTGTQLESHLVSQMHVSLTSSQLKGTFLCLECDVFFMKDALRNHKNHYLKKQTSQDVDQFERGHPKSITASKTVNHKHERELVENKHKTGDDVIIIDDENLKEQSRDLKSSVSHKAKRTVQDYINSDKKILQSRVNISFKAYSCATKEFKSPKEDLSSLDYKCDLCDQEFTSPSKLLEHSCLNHLKRKLDSITFEKDESLLKRSKTEDRGEVETSLGTFDDIFNITRKEKIEQVKNNLVDEGLKRRNPDEEEDKNEGKKKLKVEPKEPKTDIEVKSRNTIENNILKEMTEYYYFCLDCEEHDGNSADCAHTSHPRVPIGIDIAGHYSTTGHTSLQPIREFVLPVREGKLLPAGNISYSRKWGPRSRKCWKKLVMAGEIMSDKYEKSRKCLECEKIINNAIDMYSHVKTHL